MIGAMQDDELIALYHERGIPTEWRELTPKELKRAFRLWFRALPSPSIDTEGSAEAELLIHDPLTALRDAGILPADGEVPSISTFVVNHEKTLNRYVMYASVAVSKNPHTVGITIVKEAEPTEGEADATEPAEQEEADPPAAAW